LKRGAYRAAARKGKSDQIINPGASKDQIMCDLATVAFDRTARAMDQKWGVDRLVDLVSPEMAQRYGQALDRMNQAVGEGSDPQLAQQRCNDAVKGMQAMDRVATDTGAEPASDAYWELEVEGLKLGIMADMAAWPTVQRQRPDLTLVSLREVGLAYQHYSRTALDFMAVTKSSFPGAEVTAIRCTADETIDDDIPI